MIHDAVKLELIDWLTNLENNETLNYLKIVKDSFEGERDWWFDLTEEQKEGIARGLNDIDEGRTIPHEIVKQRYGL